MAFNVGTSRFKFKSHGSQPALENSEKVDSAVKDGQLKYKFSSAFGGGFRGGLAFDNGIKNGEVAPFGKNVIFVFLKIRSKGLMIMELII